MAERITSIGLDVGTTSTQLILSELEVENRAGSFSVPQLEISRRTILYKSPVHFTPLLSGELVDGAAIREIVTREYENAGISREDVDTGAIIITGETSRKENARAVLQELSGFAGDFVVATAGPDLESVLAAKGSGAVDYSQETGKRLLHMDIGGGTSNLSLIQEGKILETGCLNVGGRLVKFDEGGTVTYISPVLRGLCRLKPGDIVTEEALYAAAAPLVQALEMAAGLRDRGELLDRLTTAGTVFAPPDGAVTLSFSGGVADCIGENIPWRQFGDMGPILGRAIRRSRLCSRDYVLGRETIRATVIGAGCHSAQLSGSTVFHRNIRFPLQNLPVVDSWDTPTDTTPVLALPSVAGYAAIKSLAAKLAAKAPPGPLIFCLEPDQAKALGQALALQLPESRPILCIDRVHLEPGDYLDVGAPIGPALPVVIKTLVLSN